MLGIIAGIRVAQQLRATDNRRVRARKRWLLLLQWARRVLRKIDGVSSGR